MTYEEFRQELHNWLRPDLEGEMDGGLIHNENCRWARKVIAGERTLTTSELLEFLEFCGVENAVDRMKYYCSHTGSRTAWWVDEVLYRVATLPFEYLECDECGAGEGYLQLNTPQEHEDLGFDTWKKRTIFFYDVEICGDRVRPLLCDYCASRLRRLAGLK